MAGQELIKPNLQMVRYTAADGQEIFLDVETVKKYLVRGKSELVTIQELVFFMGMCQARKMNPIIGDCYLIKYDTNPAAIVTSVDYFRKRARSREDCVGWKSGIIVKGKDGTIKDSYGLLLDDETLLGGFFEATPKGWEVSTRLEVNLKGYIKKRADGAITRFWAPENQPSQIAKVAESQGLRRIWPDDFGKIYTEEEILLDDGISAEEKTGALATEKTGNGAYAPPTVSVKERFEAALKEGNYKVQKRMLATFIKKAGEHNGKTEDQIMESALPRMAEFMEGFAKWMAKATTKGVEGTGPAGTTSSQAPPSTEDQAAEQNKVVNFETAKELTNELDGFGIPMETVKSVWGIANFTEMRVGNLPAYKTWLSAEVDRRASQT